MRYACQLPNGGSAPTTLGFNAVAPEWWIFNGAADAAPAFPAPESTLRSHPCVALSSAQVLPEWTTTIPTAMIFQSTAISPLASCLTQRVHFKAAPCEESGSDVNSVKL